MNGNKLGKLRERLKKINQKFKTPSRVTETPLQKNKKVEYERFGVPINKSVNQVKEYQKLEKLENEKKEKIEKQITSPTGIITTNKIKELNVNTIGEEENKNVKIEVGQEEKQATIEPSC